tara:strand:- start:2 stop:751 length:750 start_codon:yes stop_codon:yes gene_type:complete
MINATVEVRMTSSRLPGKPLMLVQGKTMLEILVMRLSKSTLINKIIIATTTNIEDDPIIDLCKKNNFLYYRGSENNVLERVSNAAKYFNTDTLVQITGDCPLLDVTLVDDAIKLFLKCFPKSRFVSNTGPNISMPWGFDVQVYKASELANVLEASDLSDDDREHVSNRFYLNKFEKLYNPIEISYPYPLNRSELRVTLDYQEDFDLIKSVIEDFGIKNLDSIKMYDIIKWLDNNPVIRDASLKKHSNNN